jgi:long-chain-fatty-acid--CoA ligase ACSBG
MCLTKLRFFQLIDIHCMMYLGGSVYFAQPDALKGSLGVTMKEVRPTFFFGVPRVWEKIQVSFLFKKS